MERVVFTIIQGAVDFPDPVAQKTCFIILSKLVELWGEEDNLIFIFVPSLLLTELFCSSGGKDGMVGFPDFIYKHIVPACFLAPLKATFDLSDAQTVLVSPETVPGRPAGCHGFSTLLCLQTLSECAVTLKMIHLKRVNSGRVERRSDRGFWVTSVKCFL